MNQTNQPLPPGWREAKLGEIAQIQTGPFGSQLHEEDYVLEGTPMITVEHLIDNFIKHDPDIPRVSDDDKLRLKKYILTPGDIVYSRVGSVDRCALVTKKEDGWMFSGRLLRVRLNDKEMSNYIFYYLSQPQMKEHIKKIAVGATMPSLNTQLLSDIPVILPTPEYQKLTVNTLSNLDNKIELLRRQNKTLENIAQTLFKRWFVDFEFPDYNGKPYVSFGGKMITSALDKIPEGWRVGKLKDEFEICMGQSPKGESYNETGDGMIFFQGRTDFGFRFPTTRLFTTNPKKIANKFDVLVSVRAPVGDINMAFDTCCIGRGVGAVKCEYKSYAYYKCLFLKKFFERFEAEGTVFGSLTKSDFENVEVIIPNKNLVERFNEMIDPLDKSIFNNYIQIQTLSSLRDTLLPKLMKGEIRINA